MNVIFINATTNTSIRVENLRVIPNIGHQVGLFNQEPSPIITDVLWFPSSETLKKFELNSKLQIIIRCE